MEPKGWRRLHTLAGLLAPWFVPTLMTHERLGSRGRVWRFAGLAVGIAFSSNGVAVASPCHEIWNLPADRVQVFQAPSVDNPRSLRVPLPATADAHFHFTFTGTAVTARNVVPYGSGPVARFVEHTEIEHQVAGR